MALQDSQTDRIASTAQHVLHFLYVAAPVLGVILLLVILLAVRVWRKNKETDLRP